METLTIQDTFEPYYEGRKRPSSVRTRDLPVDKQTATEPARENRAMNGADKPADQSRRPAGKTEH